MNNKNIFSINMFWQSFKQLKAIAIVANILMLFFNAVTIWMNAIGCEAAIKMNADNPTFKYMPEIISVDNAHGALVLMFVVFTPIFALNTWKFLNRRNTSDFYHSLPYTRVCLFLSKTAAALTWIVQIMVVSYVTTAVSYILLKKYFIVDHSTLFRFFLATLICCLLVYAAISVACAVTGNTFNNIVVSGIILFLPRIMISLGTSAVSTMSQIVTADRAISFINGTQNLVTAYVFSCFTFGYNTQEIMLSVQGNIYTLVLAVIYMVLALVLFVARKSETAGKASSGRGVDFVSKFVVAAFVSATGTMSMVVESYNNSDISNVEQLSYVYVVIVCCFISAIAVVLYEFFASRHSFKFKRCLLPTACAWGFAFLMIPVLNVAADSILSYKPDRSDIEYVIISEKDEFGYYSDSAGIDYYDSIAKRTKIDDEKILDVVTEALKSNIEMVEKDEYDKFYYYGGHGYYEDEDGKSENFVGYEVYIKDGLLGKYRTIYFTAEQEQVIIKNIQNVKDYKDAFYDLPQYSDASVLWYTNNDLGEEESKLLYETFLEELKTVRFEDYYKTLKNNEYYSGTVELELSFSRDGYIYTASIMVNNKYFPKTVNKSYELSNKVAKQHTKGMEAAKKLLKECIEKDIDADALTKAQYLDTSLCMPESGAEIYADIHIASKDEAIKKVLYPAILKELESDMNYDFSAKDKIFVRVSYSNDEDMYNFYYVTYYVLLDKNLDIDWEKLYEEYGDGVSDKFIVE